MKHKVITIIVATVAGFGLTAGAQQKKPAAQQIAVMARPVKDSILLRWAPTTAMLWQQANASGYMIARLTVMRDNKMLPRPLVTTVMTGPLKPLPLAAWEPVVKTHEKYGSIFAQALYGEKFEVDANSNGNTIVDIYHKSQEQESRFGFALFAADQDFTVAKAAALGWVDCDVKPNEKYLYRVFPAAIAPDLKYDTGYVFCGVADARPLPVPQGLKGNGLENAVMLSWNKAMYESFYNAWILEKSTDNGKTFSSVSKEPLINTQEGLSDNIHDFYRIDTGLVAGKPYSYRIRGINAFGETGPASDTIVVTVQQKLNESPVILQTEMVLGKVFIRWKMPSHKANIVRFDLERSTSPQKKYSTLNAQPLAEKDSIVTDEQPLNSNYYRIKATTKDGQVMHSFPHFVQQEDSIPPVPPVGAAGSIDKKGIVSLTWEENKEKDLFGYRVFRANSPEEEFVQVTRKATEVNSYTDTISLHTLTKNVYYKLVALDKHYNPSGFSEMLVLKRPDIIPPVAPFFTKVTSAEGAVKLEWRPSSSEDVACHELWRTKDSVWEVIQFYTAGDSTRAYNDTSAIAGVQYHYQVTATDDSGLQGISKPVSGASIDMGRLQVAKALRIGIDRDNKLVKLEWQRVTGVDKVYVYRAAGDGPYQLYQTFTGAENSYKDINLLINTVYKYKLRMMNTSNGRSGYTDEAIVNY
ncbi:hypothetical protein SAMN05444266_102235 [Chitinophaga jiangningensis]|uniref:Fibronectin type-III domain-containing protein n=1 Tax=Chitinophaga jiangningensis TaxID=1419482 RepID=A0A1M6YAY2_9BACT|nr:hypothetical protein [Chitinophaga jiangningensis]SHL15446.1 hypothetical protein SAMN05444266_102235 [Chitinophaga jiangningensis]